MEVSRIESKDLRHSAAMNVIEPLVDEVRPQHDMSSLQSRSVVYLIVDRPCYLTYLQPILSVKESC